jgi:adenylate cyclase
MDRPLDAALEEAILGAPRRYTRAALAAASGLDPEQARRLWRSLGFPEAPDDAVLFTANDLAAARLMTDLTDAGILDTDIREAVARATAQSMSRLADWQVGMLERLIEAGGAPASPSEALQVAQTVLPALDGLQSYVWRRHLAATVARMLVVAGPDEPECQLVGFADMVGFTRTAARRSPPSWRR